MFQRKITRKLTLLVSAFFIFLMGLAIAAQFFVVSRTYMTTEGTKLHTNTLTLEALYFEEDHIAEIHKKDFESMRESLERIAKEYDAFCFILDGKSCDIIISSGNASQMRHSYVASMQSFIKKNYPSMESYIDRAFRIHGFLGLPTQYTGICYPLYLEAKDPMTTEHYYLVLITKEVYANENVEVLLRYSAVLFGIVACISVILAFAFSVFVTRPILKMKDAAAHMIQLDFSHPCSYKSKDELGELSDSLNFLSDSLNKTISQLHDANRKLQKDLDLQQEIDRMRKEFVSSVSHEFKTPLTLLRGYVEMMDDKRLPESELQGARETMISEIDKLDRLVLELLDLSRLESGLYEPLWKGFDIHALMQDIAQKCVLMFRDRNVSLRLDCRAALPEVMADRIRIEQVIMNFLSNAAKNTPNGGCVTLASENQGSAVRISVFNEGSHVNEADLQRIWEPFYMADQSRNRKKGGTGLGLSICREILKKHDSSFGVENAEGGIRFFFTLDRLDEKN